MLPHIENKTEICSCADLKACGEWNYSSMQSCVHLINDSYNASPTSMKSAIRRLSTYSNRRKVTLLGYKSVAFHAELLDYYRI